MDLPAASRTKVDAIESGQHARSSPQVADESIKDPNIVDWDGPDDPKNPMNWSKFLRISHVVLISMFTLYANLAATMFAPGAALLLDEFGVTNSTVAVFCVTIYILGFSIGPLVIAPLSELYGRNIIYHVCNLVYFGFTIGCALSTNVVMFLIFRFVCGCGASGPMTIGGGTIADVISPENRGKAMALFAAGPLLGPVIGPVIGGFISQNIGWRWTFWLIATMTGVFSLIGVFLMKETNAIVLLNWKAANLRKETGNLNLISKTEQKSTPIQLLLRAISRPSKMLIFSPIVLLLSVYCAFIFALIQLLFTTFPSVFERTYGFSPAIAGLSYLGLGFGFAISLALFAILSDKLIHEMPEGKLATPEMRLPLMVWFSPTIPIGFFWYGWSAHEHAHWIVPILGTLFVGLGSLFIIMPTQLYLVDVFGAEAAASALAANLMVRNLFGAFFVFAAPPLYANLGLGWGNSLLGFLCLGFAPIPILFNRYGEALRNRFPVNL